MNPKKKSSPPRAAAKRKSTKSPSKKKAKTISKKKQWALFALYSLLLLLLLSLTRFLDFTLLANLYHSELSHLKEFPIITTPAPHQAKTEKETDINIYYRFTGFSGIKKAKKALLHRRDTGQEDVIIISFYSHFHPLRTLVFNKTEPLYLSFPWLGMEIPTGLTAIDYYKYDRVRVTTTPAPLELVGPDAPFSGFTDLRGEVIFPAANRASVTGPRNPPEQIYRIPVVGSSLTSRTVIHPLPGLCPLIPLPPFLVTEAYHDHSVFLRQVYVFYFYVPLFLLLVLTRRFRVHLGYAYFVIMLFIFQPRHFIGYGPFLGASETISNIPQWVALLPLLLILAYGALCIRGIVKGIKDLATKQLSMEDIFITAFFLLLPLFLRF